MATKYEQQQAGRDAGHKRASEIHFSADLLKELCGDSNNGTELNSLAEHHVVGHMSPLRMTSMVYRDAFIGGFKNSVRSFYSELPEVKEAQEERSFNRRLDTLQERGESDIKRFSEKLAKDAYNAFDWMGDIKKSAAMVEAVKQIRKVREDNDRSTTVNIIRGEAMRMLRNDPKNELKMHLASVYAEFAEAFDIY